MEVSRFFEHAWWQLVLDFSRWARSRISLDCPGHSGVPSQIKGIKNNLGCQDRLDMLDASLVAGSAAGFRAGGWPPGAGGIMGWSASVKLGRGMPARVGAEGGFPLMRWLQCGSA